MTRLLWLLALLPLLLSGATAQQPPQSLPIQCGPYDAIVAEIGSPTWNETPWWEAVTGGDRNSGILMQMFKSTAGTFTIIVIPKPGVACIALSGHNLAPAHPEFPKKKELGT